MTFTLTCNENLLQLDEIITVRLLWIVSYTEMNVSRLDNDYDFDIPFNPDAKLIIKSKINRNKDNANWIPSSHYDYSLKEVQNQLTPAQLYKVITIIYMRLTLLTIHYHHENDQYFQHY
jgi:hypothetical protein